MKMKRFKRNLIISIALILFIACSASISVYAYLKSTSSEEYEVLTNITDDTDFVTTVSSFSDLYIASKAQYYNDKNITSTSTNRKIIQLQNDITLENDLFVTADVHLDLNNKTLYLNGNTLTFYHSYAGAFSIYNGTITAKTVTTTDDSETTTTSYLGKVVIDTPNAAYITDSLSFKSISDDNTEETLESSSIIEEKSTDYKYNAYLALYMVGEALSTSLDRRPERLTYDEVNSLSLEDIKDPSRYVSTKTSHETTTTSNDGTTSTTTKEEACTYVAVGNNLNLPTYFLATNYKITYESSSTNVLSNLGDAVGTGYVTLTVTITYGTTSTDEDGNSKTTTTTTSVDFPIHVVSSSDSTAAEVLLKSYLKDYYNSDNDTYIFVSGLELPLEDKDLNIKYEYALYSKYTDEQQIKDETSSSKIENGVYKLISTTDCKCLVVTINSDTENKVVLNMSSNYVTDSEAIAQIILNELYGGSIVYDTTTPTPNILYDIDDITNSSSSFYKENEELCKELSNYITNYNISSISYKLDGPDIKNAYTYNGDYLEVIGTPESRMGYVECTFTFSDNSEETIDLYVLYTSSSNTANPFLEYYNKYNNEYVVFSSTSSSFTLPFSFNGSTPYTVYDFTYNVVDGSETKYTAESSWTTDYCYINTNDGYKQISSDTKYYLGTDNIYYSSTDDLFYNGSVDTASDFASSTTYSADEYYYINTNDGYKQVSSGTKYYTNGTNYYESTDDLFYDSNENAYIIYNITKALPDAITFKLVKENTDGSYTQYNDATFSYKSSTSLAEAFDTWLSNSSYSLESLASDGAKWLVEITPTEMIYEDIEVLILYNYKFNANDTSWTAYQQYEKYTDSTITKFTLSGGVFYDADSTDDNAKDNAVIDSILFAWMSNTFDGTTLNSSKSDDWSGDDLFIERTALAQPATIDVTTDTALNGVDNWKGIGKLTGLTEANLSGIEEISYTTLSNFTSVQKLTLKGCKLSESSFVSSDGTYLQLSNLKELDVTNNSIETFDWLSVENFPKLEKVHITGNEQSNGYEGNTGISNYWIFEDLTLNGVTVYNTTNSNNVEIPFAESTELTDYRRLKSLAYKSVLGENEDITTVYSEFANLTLSYFNLSASTYNAISSDCWTYGGGTSGTDATYFMITLTTKTNGYKLIAKFYVDRKTTTTSNTSTSEEDTTNDGTSDES